MAKNILKKIGKIVIIIILCIIVIFFIFNSFFVQKTTIKVSGAYALYPMMSIWSAEYQELNPDVQIEVSGGGAGKGIVDALSEIVDIGMVSRDIYQQEIDKGAFYVAVAKDAVVATINAENPVLDEIMEKGITKDEFVKIFITNETNTWGEVVDNSEIQEKINVYTRADACGAAKTWALFLGDYSQEDLTEAADTGIMHDPDLAESVKKDKNGIGYNNINFTYDLTTGKPFEGIKVAPIDLNGNGKIDDTENFYDSRENVLKAIEDNIYPSPPARDLYLVTKDEFKGETKKFVEWILTEGQEYVPENGYIRLSPEKINAGLEWL